MESENLKWISITILGLALIGTAGYIASLQVKTTSNAVTEEKISDKKAVETIQGTESYSLLKESSIRKLNTSTFRVNESTIKEVKTTEFQEVQETDSVVKPVLMMDKVRNQSSYFVLVRAGENAGYWYQVDFNGNILTEISGSEFMKFLKSKIEDTPARKATVKSEPKGDTSNPD